MWQGRALRNIPLEFAAILTVQNMAAKAHISKIIIEFFGEISYRPDFRPVKDIILLAIEV